MRLGLAVFVCCLLFPVPSMLAQQHYARWEYTDLGTHHLPIDWDLGASHADFNGLVAGWFDPGVIPGDDNGRPYLFDVFTGELMPLSDNGQEILDVHGSKVLAIEFVYDHTTGEAAQFDGVDEFRVAADAMNEAGTIVLGEFRDVPFGQQRILKVEQTGDEFTPPWETEIAPGVFVPAAAELHALDFAGDWIGGLYQINRPNTSQEDGGFLLNVVTGEFTTFAETVSLVSDTGLTDLQAITVTRPDGVGVTPTAPGVLTNDRQLIRALKVQDDGTILTFGPGPIVEDEEGFEHRTSKLVVGEPLFIAGDYDASGTVTQGDLDLVLLNWNEDTDAEGIPAGWVHDFPTGRIDQAELDTVLLRWGRTDGVPVGEASSPLPFVRGIPEPATLLLAFIAGISAFYARSAYARLC